MAQMSYLSGKLNPLLARIPPEIREIAFCDCIASDLGLSPDPNSYQALNDTYLSLILVASSSSLLSLHVLECL